MSQREEPSEILRLLLSERAHESTVGAQERVRSRVVQRHALGFCLAACSDLPELDTEESFDALIEVYGSVEAAKQPRDLRRASPECESWQDVASALELCAREKEGVLKFAADAGVGVPERQQDRSAPVAQDERDAWDGSTLRVADGFDL